MRCFGVEEPLDDRDAGSGFGKVSVSVSSRRGEEVYLMAPSKLPGLKPNPCPISCKNRSPSTSRSSATSLCT